MVIIPMIGLKPMPLNIFSYPLLLSCYLTIRLKTCSVGCKGTIFFLKYRTTARRKQYNFSIFAIDYEDPRSIHFIYSPAHGRRTLLSLRAGTFYAATRQHSA